MRDVWGDGERYVCLDPVSCSEVQAEDPPHTGDPLFYQLCAEEVELHNAKNKDYRSKSDPLANFNRVAAWMALYPDMNWATPEGVAIVYAMKQQDAALSLLERGYEGNVETVDTRAQDVHVYWKIVRILHRRRA